METIDRVSFLSCGLLKGIGLLSQGRRERDGPRHPKCRIRSSFASTLLSEWAQHTSRSRSRRDGIDDAVHRKREVPSGLAYGLGKGRGGEGLGAVAEVLDPGPEKATTIRSIAVNNKSTL